MDFLGLIGSILRLIFVYKFNYKKQNSASKENYEREEWKSIRIGFFFLLVVIILGMLIYK